MKLFLLLCVCGSLLKSVDASELEAISVTIGDHQHLNVHSDDPNLVPTVSSLIVCSNENKDSETQKRVDPIQKCNTPGFIQYHTRLENGRVIHPHVDRVTPDYYYAQVHLSVYNRQTGNVQEDVCLVRVNLRRVSTPTIVGGCLALAVICVLAFMVFTKRHTPRVLSVKEREQQLVQNMALYSTIEL